MNFDIAPKLKKELKNIKSHNYQLSQKIEKQLALFQDNHTHPSLKAHKLTGKLGSYWSISIDKSIRMLFTIDENGVLFFDIGTHDQVYKK